MTNNTTDTMFHYQSCGLNNVWLKNGFTIKDTAYGKAVSIHDLEGLHRFIGLEIVNNKSSLDGDEIRFLRKELELSQVELAKRIGTSEPTIRHWESGRGTISGAADRLLRLFYIQHENVKEGAIELVERLIELSNDLELQLSLEETNNGWKAVA